MSSVRDRLNAAMEEARKRDSASQIGAAGKSRGVQEAAPYNEKTVAGRGVWDAAPYNGDTKAVREVAPSSAAAAAPSPQGEGQGTGDVRSRIQKAMEQARERDRGTLIGVQASPTEGAGRVSFPFNESRLASSFSTLTQRVMGGDDALKNLAWEMALEKTGPQRISQLDQKMADAENAGKQAKDMMYAGGRELPQSHLDKYWGQVQEQSETYSRLAEEKRKAQDDYYGAIASLSDQPQYRHYQKLGAKLDSEARESRNKEPIGAERHPMDQNLPDIDPYNFMNETERGVYQYLLGKGDKAGAQEFLDDYMAETLNARAGQKISSSFDDIKSPFERTAAKYVYGLEAGLDQAGSGAKQLFSRDRLPTSATQFASAGVRDSLKDTGPKLMGTSLGQAGYDLITTTANMAPSILLSSLTAGAGLAAAAPAVGSAAMGLTASGNAYNQALGEGYLPSQARNYAAMVGASEALLQNLLGGISSLGGTITGKTAQATIRNIDNALLRIAASAGVNMFGEGAEEYLQDILEPAFRNLCFGENNEIKLVSEEAAYSFLLGALSAGLLEGGHITGNELNLDRVGDAVRKGGKLETLLDRAAELGAGTEAGKLAGQLRDGTLHTNNGNVGQLLEAYVRDGGDVGFMSEAGTTPQSAAPTAPLAQGGQGSDPSAGQDTGGMPQVLKDMAREMAEEETTPPVLRDIREKLARGDTVSSRDTERVLSDPAALAALGVDISGLTKSQQRAAVREALAEAVREAGRGVQEAAPYGGETEAGREAAPSSAPRPDEGIGPYAVPSHEGEGQDAVTLRDGADIAGDIRRVQSAATSLGLNGSKALSSAYDETMARMVDPEQAFTVFTQTYNRALNGETGEAIGPSGKIFDTLRLAAESSAKLDAKQAAQARYFGKNAGLVRDGNWKKARLSSKDSRRIDAAGKLTGTQIVFKDRIVTEDGKEANARYKNGVLELSLNAEDPFMVSVIHETVHRLREAAPEAYQSLADFVLRTMSEEGLEFNRDIRGIGYGTTDIDLLTEETVADAFGRMLRDGSALDRFVQDNRTVGQKILDFFTDLLNSVRRVLEHKNLQLSKEQIAAFRDLEDSVSGMKRLLEDALESAEKSANQVVHSEEYDGTISEPKYSKKEGAYDTEGSRETCEDFIKRNERRGWQTKNFGRTTIAFLPVSWFDVGGLAEGIQRELSALGISSFFHAGLQANFDGTTKDMNGDAHTIPGYGVGINASTAKNAKEVAGHEAFHYWITRRGEFESVLADNIQDYAPETILFMAETVLLYEENGHIDNALLHEEFRARISGMLHANKRTDQLRKILKDYDSVKAAWNKLVEQNSAKPRYSIMEYTDAEKNQHVKDAVSYFGRTYKWAETGYITTDGKRLDFSGRHEGGSGGYRTVDHRDIRDALGDDYGGDDYSGSMVQFMSEGNIRISPESGGINLSVMPTKAQLDVLSDFISKQRGEVILDLDTLDGNTVSSTEYPRGTHANKVLSDIKAYFDDGTQPHVSEVSRFRYSIKMDNRGRALTERQRKYFKDSKAVDGDGKLLTLYHGTRKGGFTTFRDWAYLTATESYAKRYADHNTGETVYEVYANVTKPFDTRLKECRDLWRSQFFGEYSRTELQETGLPDWTDGYDLAEWIEENDLDYDCILLDEGADYDYNGNLKERGISYVVRSSEQIKNVDNKNPTSDPDIRYSIKRTSKMTLAEQLKMFYDGKMASSDAFYFGETPAVLKKSGFDSIPLAMTIGDFRKSTKKKHNIPRRVLKNLMNNLADPLFSFGSGERVGIVLDDIDGDGYKLLAALERGTDMDRKPVNVINSLYGLEHPAEWVKNQIDSGNEFVLYDEKRANAFLQTYGYMASVGDGIRSTNDSLTQDNGDGKDKNSRSDKELLAEYVKKYGEIPNLENMTKAAESLMAENQLLKERLDYWKGQLKRTKRVTTDKNAVKKAARDMLRSYGSTLEAEDITGDLQSLYDYIASGYDGEDELTYTEARDRAERIARRVVESAMDTDDELYRNYEDLRTYLRSTKLLISQADSKDIADYGEWRKLQFGRLNLGTGETNIDRVYQELSELWPEFFDEQRENNPVDMLIHIADVMDGIYTITQYNPHDRYMEQAVTGAANEIMETFFDLPQTRATFADKQASKLEQQKAESKEKLDRAVLGEKMASGREKARMKREYEDRAKAAREQSNAKLAELREKNRKRVQAAIAQEIAIRNKKLKQLKAKYAAKDAEGRERRTARELRARIIRHTSALSQKLLRPSDKSHIPESMRGAVATMLASINQESAYSVDKNGKRAKGIDGSPTKRTEAFLALKEQYAQIMAAGGDLVIDPALFGSAADDIQGGFDAVIAMRDTKLADMTRAQLETVWQVVKAVEQSVNMAGKLLSKVKYERTQDWANALSQDSGSRRAKSSLTRGHALLDLETPYTFFSHYGESGKAIFRLLRDAQDQQQLMVDQVAEKVRGIVDSKTVKTLEETAHTFTTERGDSLTLSTAHIMELYVLSRRKQAQEHLTVGGIVQPEVKGTKIRRGTDSIRLSAEDLKNIIGTLDQQQIRIADSLQRLTTGVLADFGNQASMMAYGYRKFTEQDYWPIRSAREGLHSNIEKGGQNTRAIKNIGMAKSTMPHARTPLDIAGIFATFANHAADMSDYAAWLCPMEDVSRLYNFQFRDQDGNQTGRTVKGLLDRFGGPGSQQYWHRLMEDIQNGINAPGDSPFGSLFGKMVGSFKSAAVGANLRVVIQQPTAFFRAAAVLDPKDLTRGLTGGATKGDGWKKALKYSPIAMRKNSGGFDISSPAQMSETLFGVQNPVRKLNDTLSAPAGMADAVTWGKLWNACEWATARDHQGLTKGSEGFYRQTAKLFAEVIDQTQVVDGVLQRSNIMRSSNDVVKQATSFMGEPIMSLNLLMRADDQFRYEQDPAKRGKALKNLGRAATALVVTNVVNAIAQSLVDAMRDDDEDKKYWARFRAAFTGVSGYEETAWEKAWNAVMDGNVGSNMNPIGQIPFAKDILSLLQGYNVSRTELEVFSDLIRAGQTAIRSADGKGEKTRAYAAKGLLAAGAKVFGIPVSNLTRDIWGLVRSVAVETGNVPLQYEMEKAIHNISSTENKSRYYDILYRALEQEDMDAYQHIHRELMDRMGVDGSSIDLAMRTRYHNAVTADSGYLLNQEALDLIGSRGPRRGTEQDDTFGAADLDTEAYQRYAAQRAESYRAMVDGMEKSSVFRAMSDEDRDRAMDYAYKLADKSALEDHSGGRYEVTTKWMAQADDVAAAGVNPWEYVLFHTAYTQMEDTSEVDGMKKSDHLREWLDDYLSLTEKEREALWKTVYKSDW